MKSRTVYLYYLFYVLYESGGVGVPRKLRMGLVFLRGRLLKKGIACSLNSTNAYFSRKEVKKMFSECLQHIFAIDSLLDVWSSKRLVGSLMRFLRRKKGQVPISSIGVTFTKDSYIICTIYLETRVVELQSTV